MGQQTSLDGLCECGCGQRTNIARQTNPKSGVIAGLPCRFVRGHQRRTREGMPPPNPSGLCMCGCGRMTKVSEITNTKKGWVKGEHRRYLTGHHGKMQRAGWTVDPATNCWIWNGNLNTGNKRPYIKVDYKKTLAYRYVYELRRGPIPDAHDLHHTCETVACVNPDHLKPMTRSDHSRLHAA